MLLTQKKSTSGLYKRLSTKRSLALKGIPIMDSYKLRPYKLRPYKLRPHKLHLHKLRPHKLRNKLRDKLCKKLHSKLRKNFWKNLCKNHHRQLQAIKHLKFFRPPYLKPQLRLLPLNLSKSLMQKRSTNGLYKRLRLSNKYALQRSLTLEGIPITDSYKLRPYKLCLDKLRLHKLRPRKLRLASKLDKNLCKNHHRQP